MEGKKVMKKVLFLTVLLTLLLAGSALAAPLADYSKAGNFGISIFAQRTDMEDDRTVEGGDPDSLGAYNRKFDYGAKWSWGGEMTVSFAKGWALSFDYLDSKNKETLYNPVTTIFQFGMYSRLKSHNIKLKYQAYKSDKLFIAPYLGVALNKLQQNNMVYLSGADATLFSMETERKTSVLAGLTLVYGLDKNNRLKTYFDGAIGNKVYSWNLGLAYGVSKNLDLDFGYRYHKAKLRYDYPDTQTISSGGTPGTFFADHGKIDSTSKGIYFGLSYKFN